MFITFVYCEWARRVTLPTVRHLPTTWCVTCQCNWCEKQRKFNENSLGDSNDVTKHIYRPQGKVMFSQASVILSTWLLGRCSSLLHTVRSVRILLECFLVEKSNQMVVSEIPGVDLGSPWIRNSSSTILFFRKVENSEQWWIQLQRWVWNAII